ncbi:MAG: DUF4381 domain-containing protein [Magnetococcales bacterium]|nr:DUF4381 domain-containing protein [Magnetococcales bacterium]
MNAPAPPLPLRDIHLPDPISWWPPAWGWWVVILTPLLAILFWLLWRHRARRHWIRTAALAELTRITQNHAHHQDDQRLATELSALLRRVALLRHPDQPVAGLCGEAWLNFLDQNLPARPFSQGAGRMLILAPFAPATRFHPDELLQICQQWIRIPPSRPSTRFPKEVESPHD